MHEAHRPNMDHKADEAIHDTEVEFESWVPGYKDGTFYYYEKSGEDEDPEWLGSIEANEDGTSELWVRSENGMKLIGVCSTEAAKTEFISRISNIVDL